MSLVMLIINLAESSIGGFQIDPLTLLKIAPTVIDFVPAMQI